MKSIKVKGITFHYNPKRITINDYLMGFMEEYEDHEDEHLVLEYDEVQGYYAY